MISENAQSVTQTYRKRAKHYDFTSSPYYLIGFRIEAYRRQAIATLNLQPGDTVVDLGCGTGLNLPLFQKAIGPTGKIIAVDLTDAMLEQARQRVKTHRWANVELVQSDAVALNFPDEVDGVFSSYALSLATGLDQIIQRSSGALKPGKRCVILDLKVPESLPRWLIPTLLPIVRPFAVTEEVIARRPWDTIWQAMNRHLTNTKLEQRYGGFAFIARGERAG